MPRAEVRSLRVRPFRSADLAFNVAGVLNLRHDSLGRLGAKVAAFDAQSLYDHLGETDAEGRPRFDSGNIRDFLRPVALFALRNETLRAALDEGVSGRQNAFLERYGHQAEIVRAYRRVYPAKLALLEEIEQKSAERHNALETTYTAQGRTGVSTDNLATTEGDSATKTESEDTSDVDGKSTANDTSETNGKTDAASNSTSNSTFHSTSGSDRKISGVATKTRPVVGDAGERGERYLMEVFQKINDAAAEPPDMHVFHRYFSDNLINVPQVFDQAANAWVDHAANAPNFHAEHADTTSDGTGTDAVEGTSSTKSESSTASKSEVVSESHAKGKSSSAGTQQFKQKTVVANIEFQHPFLDNRLRFLRTQATLQDEILGHAVFAQRVPKLEKILGNELEVIDQRLRQLQLNYAHTFLTAPFGGVVTGVYKELGESVQPGEPVLRLEDHADVLILATLRFRAFLRLGASVTVTTTNAFESGAPISLTGRIVSIRGHDAETDEWDVILECDNRNPDGTLKLPVNYSATFHDEVFVDIA